MPFTHYSSANGNNRTSISKKRASVGLGTLVNRQDRTPAVAGNGTKRNVPLGV
jgi:hypothetical protein